MSGENQCPTKGACNSMTRGDTTKECMSGDLCTKIKVDLRGLYPTLKRDQRCTSMAQKPEQAKKETNIPNLKSGVREGSA